MNQLLPQEVVDQIMREEQHFAAAPQAFFEAWKRGVEIAGPEWFGDGTREGLNQANTKWDLRPDMLRLNDALGATSIMVTHDVQESLVMVDYIYFVSGGQIVAEGTPDEIRASDDPFVHQFVHAEVDGPVHFDYPAPKARDEFLGRHGHG